MTEHKDDIKQVARDFSHSEIAKGFKPQALHEYQDEKGNALFWCIRLKHPETGEKWIRPLHFNQNLNKYILKKPDISGKNPLYYLPEILNSRNSDKIIWIVEGEYCADFLSKLGLLVTTSGSTESAFKTDWAPLAGRKIIIWPDNDDAGKRYAEAVSKILKVQNCSIQYVDIQQLNLPPKGDCIDWLENHPDATLQDIENLPLIDMDCSIKTDDISPETPQQTYFELTPSGVFYHADDNSRWICSRLEIKSLVRDKSSENWGRLLEFYDADGLLHRWAMPMEMLKGSGEELRGELLRLGVEIASSPRIRSLLTEYIITSKPLSRARCVNRIGWYDNVFILPDKTIGKTTEEIIYQSEHNTCDYKQSGSLEDWQKNVSQYCAGNSRLILAVSCAFAAVLLKLTDSESGGIHFVGESSTGKTTALRVAASIFGGHDYLSRWRATANGLESLASIRSDTLLVLDELSQVDAREAGEIAYMLANGMGKARANKNGHAKSRHEWRLLFLSAGEIGLSQHLQEAGKKIKAGQQVRLVDISADAEAGHGIFENLHGYASGALLSQTLLENTHKYYGTAFIKFLEFLTHSNLEQQKEMIKQSCKKFMYEYLPKESSGQVHRVCERFALMAAAGELATSYGITGWQENESIHAAVKCFHSWLEQRGTLGNQERVAILSHIRSFFELHGDARFSDMDNINPHTINRAGFRETKNGIQQYYILPEVFSKEICAGFDSKQVCKILIEEGWIEPDKNSLPYRRESFPGLGQSRCYLFTSALWEH